MSAPEVSEQALLNTLDAHQLDHVALGLLHAFGAELEHEDGAIVVTTEDGTRVGVDGATITVGDLWKSVEALT